MRSLFAILLHAFVSLHPLSAQDQADLSAVQAADKARIAAMQSADRGQLDAIFSDDLHYAHSNGLVDSKATFIAALSSGKTRYLRYHQSSAPKVTFPTPSIALMSGRTQIQVESQAKVIDADLTYLAVWRKENQHWRFLAWQSGRLPPATETINGLPLLFSEDFENGRDHWEVTDEKSWTHRLVDGNSVFGINRRESDYKPTHRSPFHIALIKDLSTADFVLTFKVRSTKDTGNHRDCCIIFNHQDPANFYYAHLGAKPDPASGQIMIVQNAPRRPITENTKPIPWTDGWHQVKVVRDTTKGSIEIYFDDMATPHLTATDTTFAKGRIGIGSFDDMNDFDDIRLYAQP